MKRLIPDDLSRILKRIDGRCYKAYKDIAGNYQFPGWTLAIDHVQTVRMKQRCNRHEGK